MPIAQHRTGSGEPLLLIHGIGSQWQMWEPVIEPLAREHEVVAIDLPGFGDSPPLDVPPTIEALADAVASLRLDRPHVAGNSLGGAIALELGARGRAPACARCRRPASPPAASRATRAPCCGSRVSAPAFSSPWRGRRWARPPAGRCSRGT